MGARGESTWNSDPSIELAAGKDGLPRTCGDMTKLDEHKLPKVEAIDVPVCVPGRTAYNILFANTLSCTSCVHDDED